MTRPHDAIRRVVDAFEQSDWAEIDVRYGDVRVHLAAGDPATAEPTSTLRPAHTPARDAREVPSPPTVEPAAATSLPDGAHVVVSPSPGIFWRSPEPGAPPFVDVGDRVDDATTLCIVEVMKLMNHVKSSVEGEVVAVYGRNGVGVVKDEPLFAIAPGRPAP